MGIRSGYPRPGAGKCDLPSYGRPITEVRAITIGEWIQVKRKVQVQIQVLYLV